VHGLPNTSILSVYTKFERGEKAIEDREQRGEDVGQRNSTGPLVPMRLRRNGGLDKVEYFYRECCAE